MQIKFTHNECHCIKYFMDKLRKLNNIINVHQSVQVY